MSTGSLHGNSVTYRCLYCRRRIIARDAFANHEAVCDMRRPMLRLWAMKIGKARQRERDVVRGGGP